MFTLGLICGLVVGTLFAPVILKWYQKIKAGAKEAAADAKREMDKHAGSK